MAPTSASSVQDGVVVAQSRGEYIRRPAHPQFSPLWPWLSRRQSAIADALGESLVLFGEWCYAVHSVCYHALPDWFLGFDVYDRRDRRFWAVARRNDLLARLGMASVPELKRGSYTAPALKSLLAAERSRFGGPLEGLYLRREKDGWLDQRAKLVRSEFIQSIGEHWSNRPIEKNHLSSQATPV